MPRIYIIKLKDITCPICKKIFHPRYNGRKYCSRKCRDDARRRKPIKCKGCGKLITHRKLIYCSVTCASKNIKKKTFLTCKTCKIKFYSGNLKSKFCSKKCYFKWFRGKNTSNWKGGVSSWYDKIKNSKEWKEWRTAVFERDDYTCQKCNYRRGKGLKHKFLHPHHIKSATKYPKFIFDINNGLTVCHSCHGKIHSRNFKK